MLASQLDARRAHREAGMRAAPSLPVGHRRIRLDRREVDSPAASHMAVRAGTVRGASRLGWHGPVFITALAAASCADPTPSGSGPTTESPSVFPAGSPESFRAFIPP